jgi:hypothetical protein
MATVDPDVASERVRLVVVRPSFHFRASDVDFPVLFLAGYSNRPEDFERELPAFDQLLDRIQLMSEAEMVERCARPRGYKRGPAIAPREAPDRADGPVER